MHPTKPLNCSLNAEKWTWWVSRGAQIEQIDKWKASVVIVISLDMRYKLCVRYAVFSMHFASIVSFVPGLSMLMSRHFQYTICNIIFNCRRLFRSMCSAMHLSCQIAACPYYWWSRKNAWTRSPCSTRRKSWYDSGCPRYQRQGGGRTDSIKSRPCHRHSCASSPPCQWSARTRPW